MSSRNQAEKRQELPSPTSQWWSNLRPLLFGLLLVVTLTLILVFDFLPTNQLVLQAGDVAPEDILAPQSITYLSEVLTERARQEAIENERDVYNPPDMRVARAQVSRTRLILDFIEIVRTDTLAGRELQKDYINAVPELDLSDETLESLLSLTTNQWEAVRQDTLNVVDEAMREQIREDRIEQARAAIPLLVRLELPEDQAIIVTALAQQLIMPNSTFNPQLTQQNREQAAADVEPVPQSFDLNSTVVRQGKIIDAADIEALQQLGLLQVETNWQSTISLLIAVLLLVALLGMYFHRFHTRVFTSTLHLALMTIVLIAFTLTAKLLVPGRALLPFIYPAAGLSMLLTVLFDPNLAIVVTICLAAVVGIIGGNSLELTIYTAIGGISAALLIRKSPRISTFFQAGILVGIANSCVVLVFRLTGSDPLGIIQLIGASFLNGFLSAGLTLAGFFLIGNIFNVLTALQLQELARLDHPLLQELLRQAPGTYHHSLMVANLAERAARQIDADAALVRVGSFYHDVGKIARPYFFTENQAGTDAHARLDPRTSAQTIITHVHDGLELAKRYRLPEKIRAFIPEHQGTRTAKFFYHQALKAAADPSLVNEKDFKYPGPKPQSRETGVVLLADSCEAASTALQSSTEEEIAQLVEKIVDDIMLEGELDESELTLGDIRMIKESFAETLQGRFHNRPKYPGQRTSDKLTLDADAGGGPDAGAPLSSGDVQEPDLAPRKPQDPDASAETESPAGAASMDA